MERGRGREKKVGSEGEGMKGAEDSREMKWGNKKNLLSGVNDQFNSVCLY